MARNILPAKVGTRKSPADPFLNTHIGPRNGHSSDGPQFKSRAADPAEMARDGYVKIAGVGWLRREYCSPSQLAAADKPSDNGNAERIERLRLMSEELEHNRLGRCCYCGAPDGACSH